jgi:tRNA(His) 5'-end guanylyltransferase
MRFKDIDAEMRRREWFHSLRVPDGMWTIVRVDGRSFSRLTEGLQKPFDEQFQLTMRFTAQELVTELNAEYGYAESDEISIVLRPEFDLFDRSLEKIVSVSAGIASARFSAEHLEPGHFDSRVWIGADVEDVVTYMSWRQADAARCSLNSTVYWTLRRDGKSARSATRAMNGMSNMEKHDLLYEFGVNWNDLPTRHRRGVGVLWETYLHVGQNPVTREPVEVTRRHIGVDEELPVGEEYREYVRGVLTL